MFCGFISNPWPSAQGDSLDDVCPLCIPFTPIALIQTAWVLETLVLVFYSLLGGTLPPFLALIFSDLERKWCLALDVLALLLSRVSKSEDREGRAHYVWVLRNTELKRWSSIHKPLSLTLPRPGIGLSWGEIYLSGKDPRTVNDLDVCMRASKQRNRYTSKGKLKDTYIKPVKSCV